MSEVTRSTWKEDKKRKGCLFPFLSSFPVLPVQDGVCSVPDGVCNPSEMFITGDPAKAGNDTVPQFLKLFVIKYQKTEMSEVFFIYLFYAISITAFRILFLLFPPVFA